MEVKTSPFFLHTITLTSQYLTPSLWAHGSGNVQCCHCTRLSGQFPYHACLHVDLVRVNSIRQIWKTLALTVCMLSVSALRLVSHVMFTILLLMHTSTIMQHLHKLQRFSVNIINKRSMDHIAHLRNSSSACKKLAYHQIDFKKGS